MSSKFISYRCTFTYGMIQYYNDAFNYYFLFFSLFYQYGFKFAILTCADSIDPKCSLRRCRLLCFLIRGLAEYPYHFYCSNHDVMVPSELLAGFWLRRPRTCYAMLNSLSKGYNPRNGLYSFLL